MKLALSTLLASIALLSPQALALGGGLSLDLQYGVRDAEALYGVATANGDLRFINQGPSAAKVRWFDPLRGEEEVRVLGPGQVLVTQGHFGVPVSEGTMVLVEKVGPGPIATGIASIPSTPSIRDSVQSLHNNGAFLPWHRGLFPTVESLVGGTMCSIESYEGVLGALSSFSSTHQGGAQFVLGDGSVRFLVGGAPLQQSGGQEGEAMHDSVHCFTQPTEGDDIFMPNAELAIWTQTLNLEHGPGLHDSIHCIVGGTMVSSPQCQPACYADSEGVIWGQTVAMSLEHGPGLHDSIHCIVGGTMCSARASDDPVSFSHHANIDFLVLRHNGVTLDSGQARDIQISIEGFIVPTEGDDIFMPNAGSFIVGILGQANGILGQANGILGQANGILGQANGILGQANGILGQANGIWTSGTASIWTSGTASIWSDGTFSSIAPDGTVDL